jgi:hypothetical protein
MMSSINVPFITINNQIIYQGDYVVAILSQNYSDEEGDPFDDQEEVMGRIYITDKIDDKNRRAIYICQHQYDGEHIGNKYGYPFSWHVLIDYTSGELISGDTHSLRGATNEEIIKHLQENITVPVTQDDDPMPADWKYEDTLPF